MEKIFNDKIDYFSNHPKYKQLRRMADDSITWNTMCGLHQIMAEDFIKRIIAAPLSYIEDWLNGENGLEWDGINSYKENILKGIY